MRNLYTANQKLRFSGSRKKHHLICEILGSHCGVAESSSLLGRDYASTFKYEYKTFQTATVLEERQPVHQVSPNVQQRHSDSFTVLSPPVGAASLLKQHDHEDKDTTILRNVGQYSPIRKTRLPSHESIILYVNHCIIQLIHTT